MVTEPLEAGRKLLTVGFGRALRGRMDESLVPLGHRLTTAGDGPKGLRLASRRRFDALLVSHPVAGSPTSRFLRAVRGPESACRTSPLVLVTPERSRRDAEIYLGRGATRVLALEEVPQALPGVLQPLFLIAPRTRLHVPTRIEVVGQPFPRRVFCETVNLSSTGMLLRTPHSLPRATELRFELFLPGLARPLRGLGRVVRLTLQGREPFPGIAVKFSGLSEFDEEALTARLHPDRP